MNWSKLSTVSIWSCFVVFIIHTFLNKYVEKYWQIILALEIILLSIFLLSELMKLIIRVRSKNKKKNF